MLFLIHSITRCLIEKLHSFNLLLIAIWLLLIPEKGLGMDYYKGRSYISVYGLGSWMAKFDLLYATFG